jgi:hypothetical protein
LSIVAGGMVGAGSGGGAAMVMAGSEIPRKSQT